MIYADSQENPLIEARKVSQSIFCPSGDHLLFKTTLRGGLVTLYIIYLQPELLWCQVVCQSAMASILPMPMPEMVSDDKVLIITSTELNSVVMVMAAKACYNIKTIFPSLGILIIRIRFSFDGFMFFVRIFMLLRQNLYIGLV